MRFVHSFIRNWEYLPTTNANNNIISNLLSNCVCTFLVPCLQPSRAEQGRGREEEEDKKLLQFILFINFIVNWEMRNNSANCHNRSANGFRIRGDNHQPYILHVVHNFSKKKINIFRVDCDRHTPKMKKTVHFLLVQNVEISKCVHHHLWSRQAVLAQFTVPNSDTLTHAHTQSWPMSICVRVCVSVCALLLLVCGSSVHNSLNWSLSRRERSQTRLKYVSAASSRFSLTRFFCLHNMHWTCVRMSRVCVCM